ncbi:MAG: LamG domain-containing protein [SAR202 cluster bacterium]|nr:LamG domain-containing protein [SAR202 cluster bacterium]
MTMEYNKIHALAGARKKVIQKFGSNNLLHLWPMSDNGMLVRDLMRRKTLAASQDVSLQSPGMLDFGINVRMAGYVSDLSKDYGNHDDAGVDATRVDSDYYLAVTVPSGKWESLKFRNLSTSAVTDGVIIAPAGLDPSSVVANAVFKLTTTKESGTTPLSIQYNGIGNTQSKLYSGYRTRFGQSYLVSGGGYIHQIRVRMRKVGSPTGTLYGEVYQSNGSILTTADNNVTVANMSTDWVYYDFFWASQVSLGATTYHFVAEYGGGDASNYLDISFDNVSSTISGNATYFDSFFNGINYDTVIKLRSIIPQHKVTFPFPLEAAKDQYWAYFKGVSHYSGDSTRGLPGREFVSSSWLDRTVFAEFQGTDDVATRASLDDFTVGVVVNVDHSPCDGTVFALADGSEAKASVRVKSDKTVEGKFKNTSGTTYTVTDPSRLHNGHNLITLSYDRNVGVKLGVNGTIVATTTPSDHALFNTNLAIGIGTLMKTDRTNTDNLKNATIDDLWLAKSVLIDDDIWQLYESYITAAPLMQIEDVSP